MFLALKDGQRIGAVKGGRAECEQCNGVVIAKCGTEVSRHWAHEAGADCDTWSEGMTQWHLDWQGRWPEFQRELVIGEHRADIITVPNEVPWLVRPGAWRYIGNVGRPLRVNARLVVEVQHSPLPVDQITEREAYYGEHVGQMAWVWDCREEFGAGRLYLDPMRQPGSNDSQVSFTWKYFPGTRAACTYPSFLDLGTDELLFVTRWPVKRDVSGPAAASAKWEWGSGACCLVGREEFVRALQIPGDGVRAVSPETPVTCSAYSSRYGLPCDLPSRVKLGLRAAGLARQEPPNAFVTARVPELKVREGSHDVNAWPGWIWSLAAAPGDERKVQRNTTITRRSGIPPLPDGRQVVGICAWCHMPVGDSGNGLFAVAWWSGPFMRANEWFDAWGRPHGIGSMNGSELVYLHMLCVTAVQSGVVLRAAAEGTGPFLAWPDSS